jgi:hypothetical protein
MMTPSSRAAVQVRTIKSIEHSLLRLLVDECHDAFGKIEFDQRFI